MKHNGFWIKNGARTLLKKFTARVRDWPDDHPMNAVPDVHSHITTLFSDIHTSNKFTTNMNCNPSPVILTKRASKASGKKKKGFEPSKKSPQLNIA